MSVDFFFGPICHELLVTNDFVRAAIGVRDKGSIAVGGESPELESSSVIS